MSMLTVNAEIGIHPHGSDIHVFVDGECVNRIGPFKNWDDALAAGQAFTAELKRQIMPTVVATVAADLQKTPNRT
jgi:hypothetical protein